jgi:photosynthetic reaction center H subunit
MKGAITSYIDVAQVTLYVFWAFFFGLIFWLRREDRREGYPLFSEPSNTYKTDDFLLIPPTKTFRLPTGGTSTVPNFKPDDRALRATKIAPWPGAPLEPEGDPMLAAVGPGSYAERANTPEVTHHGDPRVVPMRVASPFYLEERDSDPRGFDVIGGDGNVAGRVTDLWVDRSEILIRYLEASVAGTDRSVLIPMNFSVLDPRRRTVTVRSLYARHFAQVPALASPNQVTLLEEDKIAAFYGAGTLYADASRQEPLF